MTHIVYHEADLDGICSAAILFHEVFTDCKLHPMDYGKPFPWEEIESDGAEVVMVDFSLPPADMYHLARNRIFHWIDHHKSAIEAMAAYKKEHPGTTYTLRGSREIGRAGCELTWDYFVDAETPVAVTLLGRYDVFDLAYGSDVLPFQYGMRFRDAPVEAILWSNLFSNSQATINETLKFGETILLWERKQNRKKVLNHAFVTSLPTNTAIYKVMACNATGGSMLFESIPAVALKHVDALLTFIYDPQQKKWVYGLYRVPGVEIDLSAIAKDFGGGGHAAAAGFRSDKLLISL